jgi:threonylcarbamoyladenosine tRNA methylthiotransferase MtaB
MKIAFHTLGCKVNQYETEALKEKFLNRGHQIVNENDFADVYIINTCTVTSLADRKSRQYIRRMKKLNADSIVAVTGCYAQVSPDEVAQIEGVNIVTGTNQKGRLVELVEQHLASKKDTSCYIQEYDLINEYEETGIVTSMESRTRAYIKIEEGCNRFCSYCIIPYARGKVRSRAVGEVIKEAKSLVEKGFKEIILTGINTALYGTEAEFKYYNAENDELKGIEIILNELENMEGDFRIRLSSLEPTVINVEYVQRLLKYKRLCPHLHLSVQSGSDKILRNMNRRYDRKEYFDIVDTLKAFDKCYGITTDIIVGFPGESEEDFRDSLEMIQKVEFCKVHAFKYSKRQGTKAADMKGHIAPEVKNRRSEELIQEGNKGTESFLEANLGCERTVLLEGFREDIQCFTGYTENYIKVYVKIGNKPTLQIEKDLLNKFTRVRLEQIFQDGILGQMI